MKKPPTLNDEFSYTGFWWLPENPEMKWAGTITYKPETGISLDIYNDTRFEFEYQGDRGAIEFTSPSPPDYKKKFLGEVLKSPSDITLLGNHRIYERQGNNVYLKHYRPEYLLTGQGLCSPRDITLETTLKSMVVTYSSLRGWMWMLPSITQEKEDTEIKLKFKSERKVLEVAVPAIQAIFHLREQINHTQDSSGHELTRHSYIEIVAETPQTLDWFCEQIDRLRDLISFLIGIPVQCVNIESEIESRFSTDIITGLINIYRNERPVNWDETSNRDMTFSLAILRDSVEKVFQKWFSLSIEEQVPYKLCLDVINNTHRFLQHEFLALVHALESHHQVKTNTHNQNIDLIDRLEGTLNKLPQSLRELVNVDRNFLNSVKDTRNYYSHYNPEKRERAFKDFALYEAILRFLPFVAVVLYRELGIPDQILKHIFERIKWGQYTLWQRGWRRPLTRTQD